MSVTVGARRGNVSRRGRGCHCHSQRGSESDSLQNAMSAPSNHVPQRVAGEGDLQQLFAVWIPQEGGPPHRWAHAAPHEARGEKSVNGGARANADCIRMRRLRARRATRASGGTAGDSIMATTDIAPCAHRTKIYMSPTGPGPRQR